MPGEIKDPIKWLWKSTNTYCWSLENSFKESSRLILIMFFINCIRAGWIFLAIFSSVKCVVFASAELINGSNARLLSLSCSSQTYIIQRKSMKAIPEPWVTFLVSVSPYFPRIESGCESLASNTFVGPINSLHFLIAFSLARMYTSEGPLVNKNVINRQF